uniref:Transporter n=1 Tax=Plectus sambesii TaxID=2011161 RepID=A0A914VDG6_9BILA
MGEESERGEWGSQVEFLLACVGYAVGLGNIWRFPYLTYENGGAAFLIPYLVSLFVAGLPIFYMELSLGQFSSLGPNCIFGKLVPVLQGVGWGMVTVSFLVSIYYNLIIAWILIYLVLSFRGEMMWSSCTNSWNTINCDSNLEEARCLEEFGNTTDVFYFNFSCHVNNPMMRQVKNYVLEKTPNMDSLGGLNWKLVASLSAAWIVVALCLIKGVKSTGKVVYVTATFPYIILAILLIRGLTLDGMEVGIRYYILEPNMTKVLEPKVWREAATQIFYSLGVGFGTLLTLASYNKFSNNCFRDAVFVALLNSCTSIFAGFAIFSIMGFMAKQQGVDIKSVVQSGAGLAFIAYPEAISRMPLPYIWSILFFLMLLTLGLDSQFAMVETTTTALMDQFTTLRRYKKSVVVGTCAVMFLIGLPMCTRAGIFYFNIFNDYSASISLVLIAIFEFIATMYIYGLKNFIGDLELMLGCQRSLIGRICGPTGWYYKITWFALSPLFLLALFISSLINQMSYNMTYGANERLYTYPEWSKIIAWSLVFASLIWIPAFAVYRIIRNYQRGKALVDLFKARDDWCPEHDRKEKTHSFYPYVVEPSGCVTSFTVNSETEKGYANLAFK